MDDVVDEYDDLAVDEGHLGRAPMGRLAQMPVVAMLGHVEPADRNAYSFELGQDH